MSQFYCTETAFSATAQTALWVMAHTSFFGGFVFYQAANAQKMANNHLYAGTQ